MYFVQTSDRSDHIFIIVLKHFWTRNKSFGLSWTVCFCRPLNFNNILISYTFNLFKIFHKTLTHFFSTRFIVIYTMTCWENWLKVCIKSLCLFYLRVSNTIIVYLTAIMQDKTLKMMRMAMDLTLKKLGSFSKISPYALKNYQQNCYG